MARVWIILRRGVVSAVLSPFSFFSLKGGSGKKRKIEGEKLENGSRRSNNADARAHGNDDGQTRSVSLHGETRNVSLNQQNNASRIEPPMTDHELERRNSRVRLLLIDGTSPNSRAVRHRERGVRRVIKHNWNTRAAETNIHRSPMVSWTSFCEFC